ncbi:MAG: sugar transferase [Chitinophagaceae bacterium]|nr:sugar transferase [Chitinophagaceae bacterium]
MKRGFDIAFSIVFVLCILSWLLPLLALLIRLSSKGPVFFVQKRIGFGGKSFSCYKLRTMVINADADRVQATENDKRITRLGWFLRKSNMDEFPQFFNVLKGDMSIVGPRPHMYADCHHFSELLPGYKFRNMVKPGLTGLAQVKGFHGPTATRHCILMRYHWDHYYIRNIGWRLDTGILLHTIWQRFWSVTRFIASQSGRKAGSERKILPG